MASRLSELLEWERELLAEQVDIGRQMEPLLTRRDEVKARLELVQRLRSLEEGSAGDAGAKGNSNQHEPSAPFAGTGAELQRAAREILEQHGRPLHVSEIRSALSARGIPVPGRGTDANVIVHLRRAPTVFARSGRGTYGLVEWKVPTKKKGG